MLGRTSTGERDRFIEARLPVEPCYNGYMLFSRELLGRPQLGDSGYVCVYQACEEWWVHLLLSVVEEYLGCGRRRRIAHIPVRKILEEFNVGAEGVRWCGGWDLNPRRPTPSGPEPDPFDQARAPPHSI